jgi:hypothetical protein
MENEILQQRIEAYIKAYNNFDVDGMLSTLHPEIEFKNITSGEVTLTIKGLEAFKAQAEQAISLFTLRKQTITGISFDNQQAEVQIDYQGILAVDLPNGLKAGNTLELKGKSVFLFEDNLIRYIEDIS